MNVGRAFMVAVLIAGVLSLTSAMALAQEARPPLFAVLSGGNEVSPGGQANAGDPDGYGAATVIVRGRHRLCYAVVVDRIDTPTAMHIHEASAGSNGGVVIPLMAPGSGNPGEMSDCIEVADSTLLSRLRVSTANFYVNVHTGQFPDGAVRGQLH